ncbi:MAG: CesT family type III secretion system chaperone [Methylocystis sp.]|uniref:CesT family type III secretion system chaperone n=1 Tax=Methylocystis sp. TaxID=1911079 RepID=UPI003DA5C7FD
MDRVSTALDELGREIGVDVVDGKLIIPFDDFYECFILPAPGRAEVVIETALMMVAAADQGAVLRKAMGLNVDPSLVADGVLFLDRETEVLMLRAKHRPGANGGKGLGEAVAVFVEAARTILARIVETGGRQAEASGTQEPHLTRIRA